MPEKTIKRESPDTSKIHPLDFLLKENGNVCSPERISSAWCSGCGIGTVMNAFLETVKKQNHLPTDLNKIYVTSGIGCTGKIASYLKIHSVPMNDGNALHSALKYKSEHPEKKVVIFLNDADFTAFGI